MNTARGTPPHILYITLYDTWQGGMMYDGVLKHQPRWEFNAFVIGEQQIVSEHRMFACQ